MAQFVIKNIRLAGCAVVTGEQTLRLDDFPEYYNNDPALLARMKKTIGFGQRQVAAPATTTCDLCSAAAKRLMRALNIEPQQLDAVISVTQTPDYYMPGNAHALHAALGLPKDAVALDVELGCSGYVYGLWLSGMMLASGLRRVLLVAGDTLSKAAGPRDRSVAPLFGDAGSATIVELNPEAANTYFVLRSDGTGLKKMYIPAGGYRAPSNPQTQKAVPDAEGNLRSPEDIYMDGFGIFEFTMSEQPELLRQVLEFSGKDVADIDYFVLHQANRYIVETITRKAKIPPEKAPSDCFTRFGNQNSASIPGVLCGSLAPALAGRKALAVLQGFGVGLSWGACQLELDDIVCLEPIAYQGAVK